MLTPFGIATRKLRLDKGMRLLDLARLTRCSAAFISAIETGRKAIPRDNYVAKVAAAMELSPAECRDLERAADQARKEVRVDKTARRPAGAGRSFRAPARLHFRPR